MDPSSTAPAVIGGQWRWTHLTHVQAMVASEEKVSSVQLPCLLHCVVKSLHNVVNGAQRAHPVLVEAVNRLVHIGLCEAGLSCDNPVLVW